MNRYYDIKSKALEILFGYINSVNRPLCKAKGGRKKNSDTGYDDFVILMTLLIFPACTLEMLLEPLKEFNTLATKDALRKTIERYIVNKETERYCYHDIVYTRLAETTTNYETSKLYVLTDSGSKALFFMREKLESNEDENSQNLRQLPRLSQEEISFLRTINRRKSQGEHSVSTSWAFLKICCLINRCFDETTENTGSLSRKAEMIDLIRTECFIDRNFSRYPYGSIDAEKISVCKKRPDLTFPYKCDLYNQSPVLMEIDRGTETNQELYNKICAEADFLMERPSENIVPPVILIGQFKSTIKNRRSSLPFNETEKKYISLMMSERIRGGLLVLAATNGYNRLKTTSKTDPLPFYKDLLFTADHFMKEHSLTTESLLSTYRKITSEIEENKATTRKTALLDTARSRLKNIKKLDDSVAEHDLLFLMKRGLAVAASGRNDLPDACRMLLPFYFARNQALDLALYLNGDLEGQPVHFMLSSMGVYERGLKYPLVMRNGIRMEYSGFTGNPLIRRCFFEDLSDDLGAICRLREFVLTPSYLINNITAVFIVNDDERIADGRYLRNLKYWRPSDESEDDRYLEGFYETYGEDVNELPFIAGATNDFVFIHKSDFLNLDAKASNPDLFIRFGEKVIKRKGNQNLKDYYLYPDIYEIFTDCSKLPDMYPQ